jgi:hypothetical protein
MNRVCYAGRFAWKRGPGTAGTRPLELKTQLFPSGAAYSCRSIHHAYQLTHNTMEQQLLEAVLGGQLELSAALAWVLADDPAQPAPIHLRLGSPWKAGSAPRPPLRPADFRVHLLNYVREQAELVLAAAEQEAGGSGAGGSSQPPTPQAAAKGAGGVPAVLPESAATAAVPLLRGSQQAADWRRASGGGTAGGCANWPAQPGGSASTQPAPRRQQPGRIDDDNFPTLASSAASSSSSGGRRLGGGAGIGGRGAGWGSPAKAPTSGAQLPRQQQVSQSGRPARLPVAACLNVRSTAVA